MNDTKVRAVWGYPLEVILMEAHFAIPLMKTYQKLPTHSTPFAYGLETATDGAMKIVDRRNEDQPFVLWTGFSKI